MFEPDLLKSINSGRCFVFVGAGPSVEYGYPSWSSLAENIKDEVYKTFAKADCPSYSQFIKDKNYPAVFRQAEIDLGGRKNLIDAVRKFLVPKGIPPNRSVYDFLARWPFACYITTNFDNEIQGALIRKGQSFQVRYNTISDLSLLRDGVSHLIIKIHSDLEHPDEAVLTSADYDRIISSPNCAHIRDKMKQVFEMFDVLIIGHSMNDPDLRLILSTAKIHASVLHPIHMLIADATSGQIREFKEQYNIRLSTYENPDGSHKNLQKLISGSDVWICDRTQILAVPLGISEDEIAAASSLLLFQRLKSMGECSSESSPLDCIILYALLSKDLPNTKDKLLVNPLLNHFFKDEKGLIEIDNSIIRLVKTKLIEINSNNIVVTELGRSKVDELVAQRKLEEDQAYGQFELSIRQEYPEISEEDVHLSKIALRNALVGAFRSRGIAMANVVMADQPLSPEEVTEVFRVISKHASGLRGHSLQSAFLQAVRNFLIEPTKPQKSYLASVSQGFFLYHMTGLDPSCKKVRDGLFSNTCWIIDSSVLLPMMAIGCYNHDYAIDLFNKLKIANATLIATDKIIREVREHFSFALRHPPGSADFVAAALLQEQFKQNLFLDGFVRKSASGEIGTFHDYINLISPCSKVDDALQKLFSYYGIIIMSAPQVEGFQGNDLGDIEEVKEKLKEHRERRGTFRGEYQVQTEAEVFVIIENLRNGKYSIPSIDSSSCRVYFVSQSKALDAVSRDRKIFTWNPEALFRYVSSLPGQELSADLLQECMLQEYFYAGVSFIDKAKYIQYFGQSIQQAKLCYQEQVESYLVQTEQMHLKPTYDNAFESTPDLEKPFFITQMGWDLARKTTEKVEGIERRAEKISSESINKAREAEKRAKIAENSIEEERRARITAEQKAAHLRNFMDPKFARKRARQAKKRKRKK